MHFAVIVIMSLMRGDINHSSKVSRVNLTSECECLAVASVGEQAHAHILQECFLTIFTCAGIATVETPQRTSIFSLLVSNLLP